MAAFVGDLATFSFAATVYDAMRNYSWSGSIQEAIDHVSTQGGSAATTHRTAGPATDTFSFDVLIEAGDNTTVDALKRGSTGAFEFHPEGDSAGNIEQQHHPIV